MLGLQAWAAKNTVKLILYGAIAVLFIGSNWASYFYGKSVQRTQYATQENKLLVKDLELKTKEIELNAREAEKAAAVDAARDARVERGLGELKNAVQKAGVNPDCDLSDDELRALKDIANTP